MKMVKNAIALSILSLSLGACAFIVTDDGISRYDDDNFHGGDHMMITLPDGDRVSFNCPRDLNSFVIDNSEEGGGITYGCRSDEASSEGN